MTTSLPKIGTVLEYSGRRAVVIGIAGTVSRTLPVRACERSLVSSGGRNSGRIDGVHVQHLDNGNVSTVTRAELKLCTIITATVWEVLA